MGVKKRIVLTMTQKLVGFKFVTYSRPHMRGAPRGAVAVATRGQLYSINAKRPKSVTS